MPEIPELLQAVVEARDAFRDEVERAERDVERARDGFRDAVRSAHRAGVSYSLIARTLGVSRQYVAELGRDD
jgi:hypothetical protein